MIQVSRVIKRKLVDMGAAEFYDSGEADEVDGLEDIVDVWKDGLWDPLLEAAAPEVRAGRLHGAGSVRDERWPVLPP